MEQQAATTNTRQQLATSASYVGGLILGVATLAVAVSAILIINGTIEQGGGFREASTVYDVRTPGIILLGVTLLTAPLAWLVAKFVETWAKQ